MGLLSQPYNVADSCFGRDTNAFYNEHSKFLFGQHRREIYINNRTFTYMSSIEAEKRLL